MDSEKISPTSAWNVELHVRRKCRRANRLQRVRLREGLDVREHDAAGLAAVLHAAPAADVRGDADVDEGIVRE
jgi:hypothetical protein